MRNRQERLFVLAAVLRYRDWGGETISNGTRMGSRPTVCVLVDCIENDQTKAS